VKRLRILLTIAALVLAGVGVLLALERLAPGGAPAPAGDAAERDRSAAGPTAAAGEATVGGDPPARQAPGAPPAGADLDGPILLVPPGTVSADLVLRADGGWEWSATRPASGPGASRPSGSRPTGSRPAGLTLALPQSLPALTAKTRAALAGFLESRQPRPVVRLPADATAAERDELERLLDWLR
jgi:hypothetical protein